MAEFGACLTGSLASWEIRRLEVGDKVERSVKESVPVYSSCSLYA